MPRTPRSSASPYGLTDGERGGPDEVLEFAAQAVEYVRRSLGITLEYDSETLPVLDHYLRQVGGSGVPARSAPAGSPPAPAADLVAATAGAYFGEVVRRRLGGSWHLPSPDPGSWRLVLPSGLWFFPAAMAMSAIVGPTETASAADLDRDPDDDDADLVDDELERDDEPDRDVPPSEWDASLQAPPPLRAHVERVLHGMADVSEEEFYSLCGRLDTLEHVQAVLAAIASSPRHPDPDALD